MAMKQKIVTVEFQGEVGDMERAGVVYKTINVGKNGLRFLHLEQKGNTWLLFDMNSVTDQKVDVNILTWIREGEDGRAFEVNGKRYQISVHTVLARDEGSPFYHLDELPDGTWRLCYSEGFIPWSHAHIDRMVITLVERKLIHDLP
jgi:hypothetical protein